MNPLDLFLNRVERELRSMPKWKKEEELRELRSHLEQRAEDFEREGLKREDAQTRATEAFESAKALGEKLCDAWEGVPQGWWHVVGAVLKVVAISLVAQIALWLPGLVFSQGEPSSLELLALFPYFLFLLLGAPIYCGCLLSLWLGRRAPKVILGLLISLYVVGDLMIFLLDSRTGLATSGEDTSVVLVLTFHLLVWLVVAFLFRLVCQRRWRNLPPGQAPNTRRKNFRLPLRFKAREREARN